MAKTLLELRTGIDEVDRELLSLLNRRAALANEVGELKRAEGSPVFRPEREAQVINGLQEANPGPLKDGNIAHIWREIITTFTAMQAPFDIVTGPAADPLAMRPAAGSRIPGSRPRLDTGGVQNLRSPVGR